MKLVFLDAKTIGSDINLSAFETLGEVVYYDFTTPDEASIRSRDADVLIYNSTIEGVVDTREQLVKKCAMLADFKAVQSGDCWCTSKSFFQQSMDLADFILELHRLFTEDAPDGLQYFIHVE